MKIDINLSKDDCINLLRKNGYNTFEKVLGYWYTDERDENFKKICSCYVDCVFQKDEKKHLFQEKYPMIEKVKEHSIETIVSKLFNEKLLQLININ